MPLPLQLPTIQNWSCHNCGGCCRQHLIEVTAEERARIESQQWTAGDGVPGDRPLLVRIGGPWSRRYRLGHQADGGCVFLDERGLCRIHARFGEAAKPLACRVYPYAFHPAGKSITVSLRFSCPSVVANRGQSVEEQKSDLRSLQKLVVPEGTQRMPPPEIAPGERLDWPDTLKFIDWLDALLATERVGFAIRLLRAVKGIELIGQARYAAIRGPRLDEFLEIIQGAVVGEVPPDRTGMAEPSRTGRLQFRLLAAQYARKDTFAEQQLGWRHRWKLLRAALAFTRGTGNIPRLQEQFAEVPFVHLEAPFGPLPAAGDELLTRYLRVKVQGLHFFGPAHLDEPLVEGFQSLALAVVAVLWIARWLAASAGRSQWEGEDVSRALAIADHHHGYSGAFRQPGFRTRVRLLAKLDDISKLVAWYSR
ncbi:MAG: YkgJ family cysteine cluster protein [Planctomycetales bacterium]